MGVIVPTLQMRGLRLGEAHEATKITSLAGSPALLSPVLSHTMKDCTQPHLEPRSPIGAVWFQPLRGAVGGWGYRRETVLSLCLVGRHSDLHILFRQRLEKTSKD